MGCDGGTIPKRHELVKGPKKVEKVSDGGPVGTGVGGAPGERGEVGVGPAGSDAAALIPCGEFKVKTGLIRDLYCVLPIATHPEVPLIWGVLQFSHRSVLPSSSLCRHGT